MAGACRVDYSQLKKLRDKIEQLNEVGKHSFFEQLQNEMANRFIRSVQLKTPVISGDLKKAWSMDNTEKSKTGTAYTIIIINPTSYAEYVEFGHRAGESGFVEGRFMAKKTEEQMKKVFPKLAAKRVDEKLKEVLE